MSASASQTGLGGAEAPEPHSRLSSSSAIPSAADLLLKRRDFYLWRRDKRDALEHDTLNTWDKYDFAVEVVEVMAMELGHKLPERKGSSE